MAVIDPGFPLPLHPLHPFHEGTLVVHFQTVGVQPDLHLLPDEPGGNGVGAAGCLDGAPLAHPGPVVDVFRHRSWRQGLHMRAFLLQLLHRQTVAPVNRLPDEAGVIVEGIEVAAAPQHEGLADGVLEPEVGLLGHAVFVGLAGIDQGGLETVMLQQGLVGVVQGPAAAAALLMSCGGGIVAAQRLGHAAQLPEGILQSLL